MICARFVAAFAPNQSFTRYKLLVMGSLFLVIVHILVDILLLVVLDVARHTKSKRKTNSSTIQ